MNIDKYILSKIENSLLLKDSIIDLATLIGHTPSDPISSHIFCLEFDFTQEDHDKILLHLNLLSDKKALSLSQIRSELITIVPKIAELSDPIFKGMVKVFIKQFDIPLKITDQN